MILISSVLRRFSILAPFVLLSSGHSWAQGLPVDTGSPIPVALWFIGAGVLGVVLAYGIVHNRTRSRAEKKRTEQATEVLYSDVERDRRRSGNP
jgi:hypothetical protein